MFTCEALLAAAMLTAPAEGAAPVSVAVSAALRPATLALAASVEILDPRECATLLLQDTSHDLDMLRVRYRSLLDAPLLGEGQRFPDRATITDFLTYNRGFRNELQARMAIDCVHADELRDAIHDCDGLHQVWDTIRDANCTYYYVPVRRQALHLVRELIGPAAFYAGQLPPPVPIWHLPRR